MITPPIDDGTVAGIRPLAPAQPNEISYAAFVLVITILFQCFPGLIFQSDDDDDDDSTCNSLPRSLPTPKTRMDACFIFESLGPKYTRRAYRMEAAHFFKLHRLLFPLKRNHLVRPAGNNQQFQQRLGARNGLIPTTIRLAAAIRYFAGASPYDLSVLHGMSVCEVYNSVWIVVAAINSCTATELKIEFPSTHAEQLRLAKGFQELSTANFDCCVGAIDGILIWTERPTRSECAEAQWGPLKYMCGRKKKFGLNMMGTVDYRGRFLNVEIRHPGSTSDYLAFATSELKADLETPGFLYPGLVLFGDNAYSNSSYMVTPFKAGKEGELGDDFNYYQSQLRIRVECAFGRLVHRWAILRRPLHGSIGITKTNALVLALCSLHNFCFNMNVQEEDSLQTDIAFAESLGSFLELQATEDNPFQPHGLLHGGQHLDDVSRNFRRMNEGLNRNRGRQEVPMLPQRRLFNSVVNQGLRRPTPKNWGK